MRGLPPNLCNNPFIITVKTQMNTTVQRRRRRLLSVSAMLVATALSVLACVTPRDQVAACGGGSGTTLTSCSIFPPTFDLCAYTDSIGYVAGCGGIVGTGGYTQCIANGTGPCNYVRSIVNCCGLANWAPVNKTATVSLFKTNTVVCTSTSGGS